MGGPERSVEALADGGQVLRCRIGTAPGPVVEVLDRGATVARLEVTGADGERDDVGLGYTTAQEHVDRPHYLGAVIGRYANRIRDGRLVLDGRQVQLATGEGGHHLHGGPDGFDRRTWSVTAHEPDHVVLELVVPDIDQGFPGRLEVTARYEVAGEEVRLLPTARTDAPTVVNLTSHVYPLSSDQPGLQVYTGNAFDGTDVAADGTSVGRHGAVAPEPQLFRDSPNHPSYPSSVLQPGEEYRHEIRWRFTPGSAQGS